MAKRRRLTDAEGEVRNLTAADAALAKPFSALPRTEQETLLSLRKRGPQKAPRKVPISIRLSPDVAEGLRAQRERDGSDMLTKRYGQGYDDRERPRRGNNVAYLISITSDTAAAAASACSITFSAMA